MTDLARLQIEIDSSQAKSGDRDLERLEKRAGSTERAYKDLATSVDKTEAEIKQFSATTSRTTGVLDQYGREIKQTKTASDQMATAQDRNTRETNEVGTAVDKTQERLRRYAVELIRARKEIRQLGDRLGRAETEINRYTTAQRRATNATRTAATEASVSGSKFGLLSRPIKEAAAALGGLSAIFLAFRGIRGAVTQIQSFEIALAQVGAIAIRTTSTLEVQRAQFAALTEQARLLGATTRFTASQAGDAQLFLARAGFEVDEILAALPATLDLAAAGYLELGEAADIASNVLSQFGLNANQLSDVTDVLVGVANRANTDIRQLAEGLKFAGPFAAALGKDTRETAAALGALGNAGIQASLAGTNLRGIFVRLLSPATKEASDTLDRLARSIGETRDAFDVTERSVSDVFDAFRRAKAGPQELEAVFGRLNVSAAAALTSQSGVLAQLTEDVADVRGEAARLAGTINQTLEGSFLSLASAAQNLGLVVGDNGLKGGLQAVVDTSAGVLRTFGGVRTEADRTSGSIEFFSDVVRVAGSTLIGLAGPAALSAVAALGASLKGLAARAVGLQVGLSGIGLANPIGALAALTGALVGLGLAFRDTTSDAEKLRDELEANNLGLDELQAKATVAAESLERLQAARSGDDPTRASSAAARALEDQIALLEELEIARRRVERGDGGAESVPISSLASVEITTQIDQTRVNDELARARKELQATVDAALSDDPFTFVIEGRSLGLAGDFRRGGDVDKSIEAILAQFRNRLAEVQGLGKDTQAALVQALDEQATAPIRELTEDLKRLAPEFDIGLSQTADAVARFNELVRGEGIRDVDLATQLRKALDLSGVGAGTRKEIERELEPSLARIGSVRERVEASLSGGLFLNNIFEGDLSRVPDEFRVPFELAEAIVSNSIENLRGETKKLQGVAIEAAKAAEEARSGSTRGGAEGKANVALENLEAQIRLQTELASKSKDEAEVLETVRRARELASSAGYDESQITVIESTIEALIRQRQAVTEVAAANRAAVREIEKGGAEVEKLEREVDAYRLKRGAIKETTREQEIALAVEQALAAAENASIVTKFALAAATGELAGRRFDANEALREEIELASNLASDQALISKLEREEEALQRQIAALQGKGEAAELDAELSRLSADATDEERDAVERLVESIQKLRQAKKDEAETSKDANKAVENQSGTYRRLSEEQINARRINQGFVGGLSDVITGAKSGKEALGEFIQQLVRLALQQQLLSAIGGAGGTGGLGGALSSIIGGGVTSSKGNVFAGNHVTQYEKGGIPNLLAGTEKRIIEYALGGIPGLSELPRVGSRPALFRTQDGKLNSLRERNKPEAILPLARDSQGRLGVNVAGGGVAAAQRGDSVTQNYNESTTFNFKTDDETAKLNPRQLRRMVGKRQRRFG